MRSSGSPCASALTLAWPSPDWHCAYATEGVVIDERTGKPLAKVEVTILGRPDPSIRTPTADSRGSPT